MDSFRHLSTCQTLLQQCKQEAKHLLEANVTYKKIHWTHPSFISFCAAVDDILSYGVHRKYHISRTSSKQRLTSSGRVLQELSKAFPVANSTYTLCYAPPRNGKKKPDYSRIQADSRVEYKILWIRAALLEGTLKPIVEEMLRKPGLYYSKLSIMCHPVYGELFSFLLDGPCSLKFSQIKAVDTILLSPAPFEIVNRHNRVIPSSSGYMYHQDYSFSGEVWEHIQSLYQTSMTTCLFGKNNIILKPPDFPEPLEGYLTLVQLESSLFLKWLPNALINRRCDDPSFQGFHILSLDITNDVAHVHCHQGPGLNESEVILIGYNGIAYPALSFPQPLSLIHFLEALENGLHPKGCLEPPLWFLRRPQKIPRRQGHTSLKSAIKNAGVSSEVSPVEDGGFPRTWNQVFRVRFSRQLPQQVNGGESEKDQTPEWEEDDERESSPEIALSDVGVRTRISRSRSPNTPTTVKVMTLPTRRPSTSSGLEQFQCKVSYQLLARYFYSWCSYCRHIKRVKTSLSHLILQPPSCSSGEEHEDHHSNCLEEGLWREFLSVKTEAVWKRVVYQVYDGGIPSKLRHEVWPYLLKLLPPTSAETEAQRILINGREEYQKTLETWKKLERNHYHNTDPTSTSMQVRLGLAETSFIDSQSSRKRNSYQPQQPLESSDQAPNLIDLDGKEEDEGGYSTEELPMDVEGPPFEGKRKESDGEIDSGCEDRPHTGGSSDGEVLQLQCLSPSTNGEVPFSSPDESGLSDHETRFLDELIKIDKDVPRCDRDYWFFQNPRNLTKLRNIISSYIWETVETGYSQGMCDLLAPLLVTFDDEAMSYMCFKRLMETMDYYFPPKAGVQERMSNLRDLLQILEGDFFQYLSDLPSGDSLFYSYRWFLVNFKREFSYDDIFLLWETAWSAGWCTTPHFEVFVAMAILQQYKRAIVDAQLEPSEILSLFTELGDKKNFSCSKTISYAQSIISEICNDSV